MLVSKDNLKIFMETIMREIESNLGWNGDSLTQQPKDAIVWS